MASVVTKGLGDCRRRAHLPEVAHASFRFPSGPSWSGSLFAGWRTSSLGVGFVKQQIDGVVDEAGPPVSAWVVADLLRGQAGHYRSPEVDFSVVGYAGSGVRRTSGHPGSRSTARAALRLVRHSAAIDADASGVRRAPSIIRS